MAALLFTNIKEYCEDYVNDYVEAYVFRSYIKPVLIVGTGVGLFWYMMKKPSCIPPGPSYTLPCVGDLLTLIRSTDVDGGIRSGLKNFRKKYGDIYSFYSSNQLVIVLNGYAMINEALLKNGDLFTDRPPMFVTDYMTHKKGIFSANGQHWKDQRKFALETLREFGFGRTIMENRIHEDIEFLVATIHQRNGEKFDMSHLIHCSVSNIIASLVFGKRFDYEDSKFKMFLQAAKENLLALAKSSVINAYPILRFLPGDIFSFKRIIRNRDLIEKEIINPSVEEHLKHYDEQETNDYISCYIKEMKKAEKSGRPSNFDMESLLQAIEDLFVAGTETTSTALMWSILYFLHYPNTYDKCYKEIQDVIGSGRLSTMKDRPSLPYMEAFIMEVLRAANIISTGVPRSTKYDIMFRGYKIPKNCIILPNIDSVLGDDGIWGDAAVFRPERFLDAEGKVIRREEFIPFSIGRRNCLGENLAKMEIFLFLTTLIQRFDLKPADPDSLPPLKGVFGITHSPMKYEIRAIPR